MENAASGAVEANAREGMRVSYAEEEGGIELAYANFRKHHFPPHFHREFSVGVTLRGGLAFDHGGSRHVAPSGAISAINPGEMHNSFPASDEGWRFVCFLIPVAVVQTAVSEAVERDRIPAFRQRVIDDGVLARRLVQLHRILETSREPLERQSVALSTFVQLLQGHTAAIPQLRPATRERDAVRRARELLHDCYRRSVSLAELAAIAGLSRFHFLRVFRSEVGLTPHVYLNHLRVMEAKEQLIRGSSIVDAALSCGFADQSHLARRFKEVMGLTPGQFRIDVRGSVRRRLLGARA